MLRISFKWERNENWKERIIIKGSMINKKCIRNKCYYYSQPSKFPTLHFSFRTMYKKYSL